MVALHVCGFSLKYLYRDCLSWLWLLNLFALRGVKTLKIHQNLNMTVYIFGYCWHRKLRLVFPFGLLILEIAPPPCPTTAYMSLIWLIFHLFGFFFLNASHQLSSCIILISTLYSLMRQFENYREGYQSKCHWIYYSTFTLNVGAWKQWNR